MKTKRGVLFLFALLTAFGLLAAFILLGYGDVARYAISGRVRSKGQPVADVTIVFYSSSGAIVGDAEPNAEGEFEASNGGLPEGNYDIAVIPNDELFDDVTAETKATSKPSIVAAKYRSPYMSELRAEVGPNKPARLDLTLD